MAASGLRILFSGMVAGDPFQGGAIWAVMQFVLGLKRLGHEVFFVEPVNSQVLRANDGELSGSMQEACFRQVVDHFDLQSSAAILVAGTRQTLGISYRDLCQYAQHTDLQINVSGMLSDPELTARIPCRVYLDLDPAFVQLWHATQGIDMRLDGHTHFVTIGLAIGSPDCLVPTCGRSWIPTLQPVVLDEWPVARDIVYNGLTTVGNWRGYGSINYGSIRYGQKAHSFREYITAPTLVREQFMPALAIDPGETADLAALAENGWQRLDARTLTSTPVDYRRFIQGSKAEIGIAKSGYVASRCGWFSDRSVCYLASGRPVLAQDTGYSRFLPTGAGLLSFANLPQLLTAIETLNQDYEHHASVARAVAEKWFDSDVVLSKLLAKLGSS